VYDALVIGLAAAAGAVLFFVFGAIVYDVTLRSIGFQPPDWTSAITEYSMLVATLAAGPWLVRTNGHVAVESLTILLPRRMRSAIAIFTTILCVALCTVIGWYSAELTSQFVASGALDIRSIDLPKWILTGTLSVGFFLMAIEFIRGLLVSRPSSESPRDSTLDGI
jgi:C4-dicarboxylate transporter DctQ subunit